MAGDPLVGYAVLSGSATPSSWSTCSGSPTTTAARGLARSLLTAALADAADSGADRMLLEVSADNPGALAFYAAAGFTEIDRRRGYYRDGADAVVMQRPLGGWPPVARPAVQSRLCARTGQRGRLWFCRVRARRTPTSFPEEAQPCLPPDDLARRLADVAEQLLAQQRLGPVRDIAAHAVDLVPGAQHAGVSVLAPGAARTASWPRPTTPPGSATPCSSRSARSVLRRLRREAAAGLGRCGRRPRGGAAGVPARPSTTSPR